MARPTMIDLFAGCGGMTAGFVSAGFNPVAAVEYDLSAAATYAANFGEDHVYWCDIADWRNEIPEVDVVIGGPRARDFRISEHAIRTIHATRFGRNTCASS